MGEARWSWVHGLVIPTLNFELILPRKICHQVLLVTSSLGGKFLWKVNFFSKKAVKKDNFWRLSKDPSSVEGFAEFDDYPSVFRESRGQKLLKNSIKPDFLIFKFGQYLN